MAKSDSSPIPIQTAPSSLQTQQPGRVRRASAILALWALVGSPAWLAGQPDSPSRSQTQAGKKEDERQEKKPLEGPNTTITVEESLRGIPAESLTATKLSLPLQLTPLSVGVVNQSVLESQGSVVLIDALRNVSGVNVNTGFGIFDFFTIRGFDSLSSGLVLTDGAAEPESTYYQMYNVERVEVLKGPSSFLYGGNSLAGTVNLIRKQALFSGNFAQAELSFGRFQDYRGAFDLNVVDPSGEIAFRFNGTYQDSENYRDDKQHYLGAFNPSFTWLMGDRSALTVNFEYVRNEFEPDAGLPLVFNQVPDVDRRASYQPPFDFSQQNIGRLRVDWQHRISDAAAIHHKFYISSLDWVTDGTLFQGAFPNPQGGVDIFRFLTRLDDEQTFTGSQSEFHLDFRTGALRHQLLLGAELAHLGDEFLFDVFALPPIDLLEPVETASKEFLFPIPGQRSSGDARSVVFAPYILDRIILSEEVQLFVGGRLDIIDHEDPINGIDRVDRQFSPMAGVVYSPSPAVSLYASGGRAFAPPSTLVLEERQPEESAIFEAGIKNRLLGGKLWATLAFYNLEKENLAIFDGNGVTQQAGDQRSRGIEVEMSAEILPEWYSFFSYAYNDAELTRFNERLRISPDPSHFIIVDRSGNAPAFAPRHLLNWWTMREFPSGLGLGFGARFVDDQFIAEDNAFTIDDHLVFDAMISFKRSNWRFAVNFKNLSDQEYDTRGFGSQSVIPANPFSVYGSIRYSFGF